MSIRKAVGWEKFVLVREALTREEHDKMWTAKCPDPECPWCAVGENAAFSREDIHFLKEMRVIL